jgi:ribosomal protein S17E
MKNYNDLLKINFEVNKLQFTEITKISIIGVDILAGNFM